jgi:hypothetical protein
MMHSLPEGYRALVFGASGAIGQAFVQALQSDPRCAKVCGVSRQSSPGFDLLDESSMAACAQALAAQGPFHLVLDATGALTLNGRGPEKRLDELDAVHLLNALHLNAVGPSLLLKHFCAFAGIWSAGDLGQVVGACGQHRRQPQRRLVRLPVGQGGAQHVAANSGH